MDAEGAARLTCLVNQAEILPFVAPGFARVDMAGFFSLPGNVAIMDEDGAMIFGAMGDGDYEAHYLFTVACRGRAALTFARAAIALMFTTYSARAIYGATPRENRAARMMNRALGAVPCGEFIDSEGRAFIRYKLEREQWATYSAALSVASEVS